MVDLVVNSHSSNNEVIKLFYHCYRLFAWRFNLIFFTDPGNRKFIYDVFHDIPVNVIEYEPEAFSLQMSRLLENFSSELLIWFNEDYIPFGSVDWESLDYCLNLMESDLSVKQIRLARGYNFTGKIFANKLYEMSAKQRFLYSQTPALWRVEELKLLYNSISPSGIGRKNKSEPQAEVLVDNELRKRCSRFNVAKHLVWFDGEEKQGRFHYWSSLLPTLTSIVVDGSVNNEFDNELKVISVLLNECHD